MELFYLRLNLSWMFLYSSASVSNKFFLFSSLRKGGTVKDASPSELVKAIQLPVCFSTHCRPRSINSPMRKLFAKHQIELHLAERWCHFVLYHLYFGSITNNLPAHSTSRFYLLLFRISKRTEA